MAIMNGNGTNCARPGLWIMGLGHQYPAYLWRPEFIDEVATRFYDIEQVGIKKLLQINRATGIDQRPSVMDPNSSPILHRPDMPTITDLNAIWHKAGVDLSAQACRKALKEWGGALSDTTHIVACTTTCYGNPGVDLLVAERLGLGPDVERVLLAGVGCAGGMAIMRVAAEVALAATARQRPARILAFACEVATTNVRQELADAAARTSPEDISIAAALFSDGAAAFVLCNDAGKQNTAPAPLFQLMDWNHATIPNTMQETTWAPGPTGYVSVLTRNVATATVAAIPPMFSKMLPSIRDKTGLPHATAADLDWALHPGGKAIINKVQELMGLTEAQLSATKQVYKTRGNSSSPTVLIVLDAIRKAKGGKDDVVAVGFGPGLTIEMAFLRRCHPVDDDDSD
ncbi:Thiolase-like protein [Rhypophila sp. PSN 637]